ncbi:MAG: glycosyltransferase involved in cell wall biosynthesis [Oceanicoccus sp.]|jgi:glycosyltransferase involved in cell wall biosynthesis
MKLGIQGWYLAQPYTGIGQHCLGLLRELATRHEVRMVVPVPMPMHHLGIPKHWLKVVKPKWWIPNAGLKKWYWERVQVPAFFAESNPDWELYPYPCPLPRISPNLRAMTVHDTILWKDERYRKGKIKQYYHRKTEHALVDVDQIFTVSESTKRDLGIPAATVLPNAVTVPELLTKTSYGNALVYLGGYDLRKRVPELAKAFKTVRAKHPDMQLLLIGEAHHKSKFYPEIPEIEGVVQMGLLTDKQVYSTFKSAYAFVHFSDSEGFNLPLLQAMSVGTPVIARDLDVNREVSAGTAKLLEKPNGKSLLDAVEYVRKHRKPMIANQKKAAQRYSWKKSTSTLLKALK